LAPFAYPQEQITRAFAAMVSPMVATSIWSRRSIPPRPRTFTRIVEQIAG
jgi:hypothetical protein